MTGPASPRYEVQTRSGSEWGWHCGSSDITAARKQLADARRTGYRARILDTFTGSEVR